MKSRVEGNTLIIIRIEFKLKPAWIRLETDSMSDLVMGNRSWTWVWIEPVAKSEFARAVMRIPSWIKADTRLNWALDRKLKAAIIPCVHSTNESSEKRYSITKRHYRPRNSKQTLIKLTEKLINY